MFVVSATAGRPGGPPCSVRRTPRRGAARRRAAAVAAEEHRAAVLEAVHDRLGRLRDRDRVALRGFRERRRARARSASRALAFEALHRRAFVRLPCRHRLLSACATRGSEVAPQRVAPLRHAPAGDDARTIPCAAPSTRAGARPRDSSLEMRAMSALTPASAQAATARSYQVQFPEFVTWYVPNSRRSMSASIASARSCVHVGAPRWSSTTRSGSPARLAHDRVHEVAAARAVQPRGAHDDVARVHLARAASPASFDLPYTPSGPIGSCSRRGVALVPSKT